MKIIMSHLNSKYIKFGGIEVETNKSKSIYKSIYYDLKQYNYKELCWTSPYNSFLPSEDM